MRNYTTQMDAARKDELTEIYEAMKKNQYGQYLKDVMDGKYREHLY